MCPDYAQSFIRYHYTEPLKFGLSPLPLALLYTLTHGQDSTLHAPAFRDQRVFY